MKGIISAKMSINTSPIASLLSSDLSKILATD